MTLLEKINQLNLKPRNAPAGVKVSTFGEWLRKLRSGRDIGEIPAALLTLYCDGRINESGGLKLGSAEIFSEIKPISLHGKTMDDLVAMRTVVEECKQVMSVKLAVPTAVLTDSKKIPAKKPLKLHITTVEEIPTAAHSITLRPFALNTMDDPMTRKLKSDRGSGYWILYCKKNKYRLELADAGCSIVTGEGTFVLSNFTEKE